MIAATTGGFGIIGTVVFNTLREPNDLVAVLRRHPQSMRIQFDCFTGKTVCHCRIPDYEDHGVMRIIEAR
ncbi:hypothetical protein [Cryobacterium psychrophilum]|uniref:Uncharacterized protein n=1 Tax=Cryobacterium psychrophilum TaxID=41988 RepID=A0A4Y8KYG5_9MICO|nr:hypothetical protein [Cryobacterium psychrophilum]TFD82421.1 hypothetical protein E3T53_00685 [Cryobacterium psychrophilum]